MSEMVPVFPVDPVVSWLEDAYNKAEGFARNAKSNNTRKAYRKDWEHFVAWCGRARLEPLPAVPGTIALYLASFANELKVSTLQRRLSAISQAHKLSGHATPVTHPVVGTVWDGIRRTYGVRQEGKQAVSADELRRMIEALPGSVVGIRNKALLLVGYFGAFRRSELVSLDVEDCQFISEGLLVRLNRSKTDQTGKGEQKAIPFMSEPHLCPVRSLQTWITTAHIELGPLFRPVAKGGTIRAGRLSDKTVVRVVKNAAEVVGMNPQFVAGHSLRAGFATQAALHGASDRAIMNQTGHKSRQMVDRYVRLASIWQENAAAKIRF